jgi:hypothetical protein
VGYALEPVADTRYIHAAPHENTYRRDLIRHRGLVNVEEELLCLGLLVEIAASRWAAFNTFGGKPHMRATSLSQRQLTMKREDDEVV